ncbi:MAG TPA: PilZ domain-containing protein [Azospirillaceae bacterium]|nr:PilZ domain-containing protein [Azospirillaceae bacterium]
MEEVGGLVEALPSDARAGALSRGAEGLRARILDCYRMARKAAEPWESDVWIRLGAWFESLSLADETRHLSDEPDAHPFAAASPDGRRRWRREPLDSGAILAGRSEMEVVRTRDISPGGACLTRPARLSLVPGQIVSVSIPEVGCARLARIVAADAEVVRCEFVAAERAQAA